MDPVTVILGALVAASARVTGQAVSDAYTGLRALIVRKFGHANPRLEQHLDDYVGDPDTYEKPAQKVLREVGAGEDEELVAQAVNVLKLAEQSAPGITGGMVGQINAEGVVVAGNVYGGVHFGGGANPK